MHHQSQAAIIANDLDSMVHRIEALPAHTSYTEALMAIQKAKVAILNGASDLHQRDVRERFAREGL
jgi:hypothetical protein